MLRHLIRPAPGFAIAYVDFEQEEFGIAAWLSKNQNMLAAYAAGDVYLAFAKQCGAIPTYGTKETHTHVREQFKQVVLAVGYGEGATGLSQQIGTTEAVAQQLLDQHRKTYGIFWEWSDRVIATVQLAGSISTRGGWRIRKNGPLNGHQIRSLRNFPMQSTGSDILRLTCSMAIEAGLKVVAPIHDAVLLESKLDTIYADTQKMRMIMAEASKTVLGGFELRTDAKIFTDRFKDERGASTWNMITRLLATCNPAQQQHDLFSPKTEQMRVQACA